jgi:hypothetical protein
MGLPLDDWQFWVVSGAALAGLLLLVRPRRPRRRITELTIEGRKRRRRPGARSAP